MRLARIALLPVGLLVGCGQDRDEAESTTWVAEESQAPAAAAAETANDASAEAAAPASQGFVWHELLSPAAEAAADFYTFVFDWSRTIRQPNPQRYKRYIFACVPQTRALPA
ncbi:hypothetical protein RM530_15935 [Algiphilus sp. W345]|uniref:Lipoprotein n=1 Tax=Banduia mediterranea TaxID=3075609 RepID=A0ABU2WLU0_9GAMM|nr:hypothetical protein [Algiphilus sp. W345]MDT0498840.1 hypothetical protein [Algiphilus sp. W345]